MSSVDTVAASSRPVQRLSLQEALAQATVLQRTEKLAEAQAVYAEILEQIPEEPNALHFLGILRFQQGDRDEAVRLLQQAADRMPDEPGPSVNLGNVLLESQRFDDAIDAYRRAVEIAPDLVQAWNNLGILRMRRGEWDHAEASFRRALEVAPSLSYVHHNFARMLYAAGRYRESAAHGMQSLALDPTSATARKLLSMSQFLLGDTAQAVRTLEEWQAHEPYNPEVVHHLAACGAAEVPGRASNAYVEQVFDQFAASFDQRLESLGYQAPQHVHAALESIAGRIGPSAVILDAGCGTGLCGALIRPQAGTLHGVDLSAGMLERARQRGIYDKLERGELTAYLQSIADSYDAVVSADTLCYFGELEGFLSAARRALRPNGALIFTLEALADTSKRFALQVHGRYAHSAHYVQEALAGSGFTLASLERGILRNEFIEPVEGWIVVATCTDAVAGPMQAALSDAQPANHAVSP